MSPQGSTRGQLRGLVFVSRWDKAVMTTAPTELRNRLGIAIAKRTYAAYRQGLASPRWQTLAKAGAQPQRLLWASTSTKNPSASDVLYIEALAAPDTIDTIPEETLRAFAEHGHVTGTMPEDGGDAEDVLGQFTKAGVDVAALGDQLQREGAQSFDDSWNKLLRSVASKSSPPTDAGRSAKTSS